MLKGSEARRSELQVDRLFVDRWSPRAMSGEPIDAGDLMLLFEAARWAPSSGNAQPWRMLYGRRETPHWPLFFDLLNERNRLWCVNAAALIVFASRTVSDSGRPLPTHSYDTGAAWENFALQGTLRGYVVHGMAGFDYDRARVALEIPPEYRVEAMAAVGRPGRIEDLEESFRARETPSQRKPLDAVVCEGVYRL
jgi:nitroreductase